jgi:starch phosphorylase
MKTEPLTSAELTDLIHGLNRLARNLWWTWNQEAQELFQRLSPRAWQNLYHNAVAVLHEVSDYELRTRLQEPAFAADVRDVLKRFNAYMEERDTWAAQNAQKLEGKPVAYFSAEFGLHETLPIAAGGLGILAGDHAKSASDLGLPFVGVSLFYRQGYFMQTINEENWQTEYYSRLNPRNLPMEAVLDAKGEHLTCMIQIATSQVKFKVWKVNVGRIPIYLMDTDLPENEEHYRELTLRVYGGDSTTRIMQEMLLGVGGVRLMRALDIQPSVFHMNEGHAAFLTLELMREKMATGHTLEDARKATTKECIFTTHTPVEAGHDRFTSDLVQYAAHKFANNLKISHQEFMDMGRVRKGDESEPFCMTVLALKHSRTANGVSELHGEISRQMWQDLYADKKVEEVPIGHITNGIHVAGWMKGPLRRFFRRRLGEHWDTDLNTRAFWNRMEDPDFVSDEEIWALRSLLRRELIEFSRRRLLLQSQSLKRENFITFDHLLNPDVLTIGFARRFATYKRAPLVFQQFEQIVKLVKDKKYPIQFIFAGKAHPRDDEGKRFIQHIIHLSKHTELHGHLVFIENYDIHVARQMVSGCDIWLNNPRRPLEASGTSGQKTSAHGCLNMSILDGWWREAFDETNGFAIGPDSQPDSIEEQDRIDSANLYKVLTQEVIPGFYNRDSTGIPRQWIQKIRRSMSTITPEYSTWRMVQDYANKYYLTGE